jgi:hypothetical protein
MSEKRKTALERAFELAKEGKCRNLFELNKRLKSEKYDAVYTEGSALKKQLLALIEAAKRAP